jgi:hypothetical protein
MRTEMDALVLGNYLLLKGDQPPWPEDNSPATGKPLTHSSFSADFIEELRAVYTGTFLPVMQRIRSNGYVPMRGSFKSRTTLWQDFTSEQTPATIFSIPTEMAEIKDPARTAAALTGFWRPGEITETLRPVVAKILAVGARHPSDQTLEEEVSESVYVMF